MPHEEALTAHRVAPLTRLAFSIYGSPGVYALLVGSGLSRGAQIPTGWEVTLDLVRRQALAQGEPDQPDWATWYRTKFATEPNYSDLLANWPAPNVCADRYVSPGTGAIAESW